MKKLIALIIGLNIANIHPWPGLPWQNIGVNISNKLTGLGKTLGQGVAVGATNKVGMVIDKINDASTGQVINGPQVKLPINVPSLTLGKIECQYAAADLYSGLINGFGIAAKRAFRLCKNQPKEALINASATIAASATLIGIPLLTYHLWKKALTKIGLNKQQSLQSTTIYSENSESIELLKRLATSVARDSSHLEGA